VTRSKIPFWFKFWGTRGSLPAPRPTTNKYGGNTPCMEVRAGKQVLIFDAGSGIRALGEKLLKEFKKIDATLLFSHYHWDHIHGFPFFAPAFNPNNHFVVYGEPRGSRNVKDILSGQMAMPYFPVPLEVMQARFDFRDVRPRATLQIGQVVIKTQALNHPGHCLSYRIEYKGKSVVYATDTEHGSRLDSRLVEHARGADYLIYDAAYTDAEINAGKKGFGHSTWREGVKVARAAEVKKLLLFHHEPCRDDRALSAIEEAARRNFKGASAARERKIYRP
jgi:phosphoribosyl 1,2-cyclic phosphodiesterase